MKRDDEEEWLEILSSVNDLATEFVRGEIKREFENSVSIKQQDKAFKLEDLTTLIANIKKDYDEKMLKQVQEFSFQLEDLNLDIANALKDYEIKVSNRLAFLREQASIARKLDVAKSTIEAQNFSSAASNITNIKTDSPFYMRGYEAIEKEIELIESREDKTAFVNSLLDLEQKKRAIQQDKTLDRAEKQKMFLDDMLVLEKQQRAIQQDKTLDRIQEVWKSSPIINSSEFIAVSFRGTKTTFKYDNKKLSLLIALSIILGGIIGVIYVLIFNAVRNRKEKMAKA